MLTPRFTLSQNERHLIVHIRVPFAKISETEVEVVSNELYFYSKPYHLRLYLTGDVVEEDVETDYQAAEATFDIRMRKKAPGTHFPDLEMITKLLTPPGSWRIKTIEELDAAFVTPVTENYDPTKESVASIAAGFDWHYPQTIPPALETDGGTVQPPTSAPVHVPHKYGFGLQQSGVFHGLTEELRMVIDIKDVDSLSSEEVHAIREKIELEAFDPDHYLADMFCNEEIHEVMDYKPWWKDQPTSPVDVALHGRYTEEELDILKELPRQHLHVHPENLRATWNTLAELVFSFAYDHRITLGEPTVESSWTVAKLSPALSCLDSLPSAEAALLSCFRRSLCFPLYRNFELATLVVKDVQAIFGLGRWALLKCLLAIRKMFGSTQENRYILNDLYIISYCVWIQNIDEKEVADFLTREVAKVKVEKDQLKLDLEETEAAAYLAMKEEKEGATKPRVADLEEEIAKLKMTAADSDDE
ncbi:hypothetical protein RvY_06961 [Ramazzottius varieornatus]|uniref:Protein SHQ1 homolog n=1 Tax=Ramazzottius varieornatus TaxID=947166 RepID=A0A1D1V6P9_RAMVA|nr:hypothetical protein RvY_06961 [Ramazzottius varieornatus]